MPLEVFDQRKSLKIAKKRRSIQTKLDYLEWLLPTKNLQKSPHPGRSKVGKMALHRLEAILGLGMEFGMGI